MANGRVPTQPKTTSQPSMVRGAIDIRNGPGGGEVVWLLLYLFSFAFGFLWACMSFNFWSISNRWSEIMNNEVHVAIFESQHPTGRAKYRVSRGFSQHQIR